MDHGSWTRDGVRRSDCSVAAGWPGPAWLTILPLILAACATVEVFFVEQKVAEGSAIMRAEINSQPKQLVRPRQKKKKKQKSHSYHLSFFSVYLRMAFHFCRYIFGMCRKCREN